MRLIDADRLKAEIMGWCVVTDDLFGMGKYHEREIVLQAIEESPSIDAEPVVYGRIESNGDCSECGYPIPTDNRLDYIDKSEVRYCYYCGAKMEVEP